MVKYGRENRRRSKRENKVPVDQLQPWAPPIGDTNENTFVIHLGSFFIVNRELRLDTNQMLVEFAVILKQQIGAEQLELVCIDSCNHKNVHKHLNNHSDFSVIKELLFEGDLDKAFIQAQDEVFAFYENLIGAENV